MSIARVVVGQYSIAVDLEVYVVFFVFVVVFVVVFSVAVVVVFG